MAIIVMLHLIHVELVTAQTICYLMLWGTKISFRLFGLCTLIWPSIPVLSTFSIPFFSSFPLISSPQVKAECLSHNRLLYSFFALCFTVLNVIAAKDQMQVVFTVMKKQSCLQLSAPPSPKKLLKKLTIYSAGDRHSTSLNSILHPSIVIYGLN